MSDQRKDDMQKSDIHSYEKKYDNNGIQIIGKTGVTMADLILQLENWHDEITKIILCANNLYYYATNNSDSDYYLEELSDSNLQLVKKALEIIIKEPEKFYNIYQEKCYYYTKIQKASTIDEIEIILKECGIKMKNTKKIDIERVRRGAQSKLCTDYCFGVFGEMLFYNVVENILYRKLLLSKVELITAPNTNAHGSDGVFCDENKKILYFGEAKFTVNLSAGITQALSSMEKCLTRVKLDKDFMLVHGKDLKNGYGKQITVETIDDYKCEILIFLLHGIEVDYEKIVQEVEKNKEKFTEKIGELEFTIISFPIFDKEHLKESIAKGVENYGSEN
ncbi:DUF1837 domain-containing protein [Clostridium sp. AF15-31]|nr:DUF1837 domain-containing protein [Clostridium sp. AF15-31]